MCNDTRNDYRRCENIFDPNEWIDFVGGKAKGVKLEPYTFDLGYGLTSDRDV